MIICIGRWKISGGCRLGRTGNQNFIQIPHGRFRLLLSGMCEKHGITYYEVEESYTSKAFCLDLDDLPVYAPGDPAAHAFSGERVKRGLYRTESGKLVNADINGAGNILRKGREKFRLGFPLEGLRRGLLDSPARVRIC